MTGTTPNPDPHIEPTGALREWLVHYELLDLWHKTAELPTKRADYYKAELLRAYLTQRRREERSQRYQLSRGGL